MSLELPVMLTIVLFLALGIFSQWLASRIKWPSIVVMAIVGLLVGPIFGLANPKEALGPEAFSSIVSLAVAIILFEGSSNCLLYTSPSPRDRTRSRMPSSA